MIVDLQQDEESQLMFASIVPHCDILAGGDCQCRAKTDERPAGCTFKSLKLSSSFTVRRRRRRRRRHLLF